MNPVKLRFERKTKVPTKHQNVHKFRSDWKKINYLIDYHDSPKLFSFGSGVIENDAQFCKWIRDKFGLGIYKVMAWKMRRKGFWCFMKIELGEKKFRRLKRNPTSDEIELKQEIENIKMLERKKISQKSSDREETEDDIETSQEYAQDIKADIKNKKSGCYPYLKSMQPVYLWHSYEDYEENQKEEKQEVRLF